MSLWCRDGERADIPPPSPMPALARGEWRPPDPERDRCRRCGLVCWQHWTVRPEVAA